MSDLLARDVEYVHDGTRLRGRLCAPAGAAALPAVVLVHDAYGLSSDMMAIAERLAALGLAVLAADVWGERTVPAGPDEVGPLIGAMVRDRPRWLGRVAAAHAAAVEQPEVDGSSVALVGYCFGGSSALEYLRSGADVRGVVAVHPGLDLLDPHAPWPPAVDARVLVCTGGSDPMATAEQRTWLETGLTSAGADWELDVYGGATHAFSSLRSRHSPVPELFAYDARSAARAWRATTQLLAEVFPSAHPAPGAA